MLSFHAAHRVMCARHVCRRWLQVSTDAICSRTKPSADVEETAVALLDAVQSASQPESRLDRVQALCQLMAIYPAASRKVYELGGLSTLQRIKRQSAVNSRLHLFTGQALNLLGNVAPFPGRGLRVLSLDGGGIRGLSSLRVIERLQGFCGNRPLHTLFDVVCGCSTGAMIATLLFVMQMPVAQGLHMYRTIARDLFDVPMVLQAGKFLLNQAFYDGNRLEKVFKENVGDKMMIDTTLDLHSPRLMFISALVGHSNAHPVPYVFRNYRPSPDVHCNYVGGCNFKVWQALSASCAAPGYFPEVPLHGRLHQDGGLVANNPSAIALHESRVLWGTGAPLQCLISVGTGKAMNTIPLGDIDVEGVADHSSVANSKVETTSLRAKLDSLVNSASNTQTVHHVLRDLLPPSKYYRFNPPLTENIKLDECDPYKITQLEADAEHYLDKNEEKLRAAARQLLLPKTPLQRLQQTVEETVQEERLQSLLKVRSWLPKSQ